jgi:starvation-inducible DNA-binding protein
MDDESGVSGGPNPALPDDVCEEIGKQLQLTLVELIALSLAGKQLQWTSYGREFVSVHRHLDHLVDEWRELEDEVAERAAAIGIALDGTAAAVLELDDHRPLEPGFTEVGCAIERLCSQLWDVALRVLQRGERLGALDAVSQHVLIGVQRTLETSFGCCGHSWLTSTSLRDPMGLPISPLLEAVAPLPDRADSTAALDELQARGRRHARRLLVGA